MPPEADRRLAAILSADVAGYSRLMADDEDATIRTLRAWREQVATLIAEHRGRLVDFTGDNFLAEFPSARDAVECALEIQRVLESRNVALPDARRMRFRIGAHLGDVRVEDGRLFGDGVNTAARMQQLSEAGGLCLSAMVVEAVRGKIALDLEDLGEQALKNLPNRLRAFRVPPAAIHEAPSSQRARSTLAWMTVLAGAVLAAAVLVTRTRDLGTEAPLGEPVTAERHAPVTLAVLPFVNMSDDASQTYFAEGLSEELINVLAQTPGLKVAGRTSSFAFKGQGLGIDVIGKRLGVDNVLEGSVRRDGNVLRVTAQLVNARDGFHLWSDTYDRELADVLRIQREIAEAVAGVLEVKLGLDAVGARHGTADPAAHVHYLVGRALFYQHTPQTTEGAIAELESALSLDPGFSLAWVELAYAYGGRSRDPLHREEALKRMAAAAVRAHALAPDGWRSEAVRAWVAMSFLDFTEAELAMERAVALRQATGSEDISFDLANFLINVGRPNEALAELTRLRRHDPLTSASLSLLALGRKAEAIAENQRVRELGAPRDGIFELSLAMQATDAHAMSAIAPGFADTPLGRALLGPREAALARLRERLAAPNEAARGANALNAMVAERHGDLDLALAFLRREFLTPGFGSFFLIWHPGLQNTRATPGFRGFVRELGLEAMWRQTGKWGDFCRPLGADDLACQ
ncbi:MAG TPA: adenylate/guanylate cyclase domain-containing protein [Myxococcota bacterium]